MIGKAKSRGRRGFSLIEVLIAIIIIGILMAVAVPRLLGSLEEGADSAAQQQLQSVQNEATTKFYQRNSWPSPEALQEATGVEIVQGDAGVGTSGARQVGYNESSGTLRITALGGGTNCWYVEINARLVTRFGLGTATNEQCSPGTMGAVTDDFGFPPVP